MLRHTLLGYLKMLLFSMGAATPLLEANSVKLNLPPLLGKRPLLGKPPVIYFVSIAPKRKGFLASHSKFAKVKGQPKQVLTSTRHICKLRMEMRDCFVLSLVPWGESLAL